MTKYEEYAILDAQIKVLTNQKDELKASIIEKMIEDGEEKKDTSVGKFTIAKLKTWEYTDKVTELKELLDERKAKEESEEIATCIEKPSLRYTAIKL